MKAIVLVAGMGTRLKPLTNDMPKCLTTVNGKTILDNALEILEKQGVEETVLVIGYLSNKIRERISDRFGKMRISYVENDIYSKTNTSYSLWLALKDLNVKDSLLILEGDVFFEEQLFKKFVGDCSKTSTIVQKYNPALDGSFVELDSKGIVADWIHKSRRTPSFKIEDKFKTVNIHKFDNIFLEKIFKPLLKKHVRDHKGTEPLEYVMQDMVKNKGAKINSFEVSNLKWFEIDDINDLKIAEEIFKPSLEEIKSLHGGYWRYNILDFHYLTNNFFPTKEIYGKLREELPVLVNNYPSTQRVIAKLLSKWKNKSYFNEENLIVTNGSSEAIKALNGVINNVTLPVPTFNEYTKLPPEKISYFLLDEKNKFKLDINKLIQEVKRLKSDFVIINNPNNPVGNVVPRKDIIKLLDTGINVVIDEAFIDFCIEDSVEDLVEKYNNLVIIKTVTKTMGLAGLRLGYVLTTNKKIRDNLKETIPIWNVNSIAERFIELFVEHKKEYWDSIEQIKKQREELFARLKGIPFLEPYETKSNFIFCKTKVNSNKLAEELYEKYNIILRSALNQEMLKSDSYIRVAVRTKEDNDKLIFALKNLKW
jgi:histidinol-phosphate/aromatic aminotransferase/cobyric acid decarboxylase-like protein/choline kinase